MLCLECGKECKTLSFNHLKYCSGITPKEYKIKHNVDYLSDLDIRLKSGRSGCMNPNYKNGVTILPRFCRLCNKPIKIRKEADLCCKCAASGTRNGFYGKTHTSSTKLQMKKSAKLRDKNTYKYGNATHDVMSLNQKKYWARLTKEEKIVRLSSFVESGHLHSKKNKNTKIEQSVAKLLTKNQISYKQTALISGTLYRVDFLLSNNCIVECYGDYWHCNPKMYHEEYYHKNLKMTAKDKWAKDHERVKVLESLGYTVTIIWESDNLMEHYLFKETPPDRVCQS